MGYPAAVTRIVFLSGLTMLSLFLAEARAQTACPMGSAAGSAACGPDSITGRGAPAEASRPTTYVRYPGYGAVAVSRSLSKVSYFLDAGDGIASSVREAALASCRNDGATDCEVLHEWTNACVAVGSVPVDGIKQIFVSEARTKRAAERQARSECERRNPQDECRVPSAHCAKGWGGYVSY